MAHGGCDSARFTVLANVTLTGWTGRLPDGWFTYNGYEELDQLYELLAMGGLPLVGSQATVIWNVLDKRLFNKKKIIECVCNIRQVIFDINPSSIVYFVTHLPMQGERKLHVINHNKNLLFALRKLRREEPQFITRTVALHHWCIRQKREWRDVLTLEGPQISMLLFLIVREVES